MTFNTSYGQDWVSEDDDKDEYICLDSSEDSSPGLSNSPNNTPMPSVTSTTLPVQSLSERINRASLSAWPCFEHQTGVVPGSAAYDTLKQLYFGLQCKLSPHSKRSTFTKEECLVLWSLFHVEAVPARGKRQPAEELNTQLKASLSAFPILAVAYLKEVSKKCTLVVRSSNW
jgi:hypothetical protein